MGKYSLDELSKKNSDISRMILGKAHLKDFPFEVAS